MRNIRQTKEEQFLKGFWILKTNLLKIIDKLCTLLKIWDLLMIRNLKNEKILKFLIDPLIESGPDP